MVTGAVVLYEVVVDWDGRGSGDGHGLGICTWLGDILRVWNVSDCSLI